MPDNVRDEINEKDERAKSHEKINVYVIHTHKYNPMRKGGEREKKKKKRNIQMTVLDSMGYFVIFARRVC